MENYDALTFENKIKVDGFVDMFYGEELGMFSLEELMGEEEEEEEEAVKVAVKEYLNFF